MAQWKTIGETYTSTSDSAYKMRLVVYGSLNNDFTIPARSTYVVRLWLMHTTDIDHTVHEWDVKYTMDSITQYTIRDAMPMYRMDIIPQVDTSSGKLHMTANTYYSWCDEYVFEADNDGSLHSFGVLATCGTASPTRCPNTGYCTVTANLLDGRIIPGVPVNFTYEYNPDTRQLTCSWDSGGNTESYALSLTQTVLTSGVYLSKTGVAMQAQSPYTITLEERIVEAGYRLDAISSTGDIASTGYHDINLTDANRVRVKVGGVWKPAITWVKVNGIWKKCSKVYIKNNNTWKQVKS